MRLYLAALLYALYYHGQPVNVPWPVWSFLYRNHLTPLRLFYRVTGCNINDTAALYGKACDMRRAARKLARQKGWVGA